MKTINQAPHYSITKKGAIKEIKTKKIIAPVQGFVTLKESEDENAGELFLSLETLIEEHFPKKEKGVKTSEKLDNIKRLLDEGKTRKEIREILGLKNVGGYIRKIQGSKPKKEKTTPETPKFEDEKK